MSGVVRFVVSCSCLALLAWSTAAAEQADSAVSRTSDSGALKLTTAPEIELRNDVVYGTGAGKPLKLHLAKPKHLAGPVPCVVFIHGGSWMMGNKNQHNHNVRAMAEHGYVSVTVGYRFAPKHPFPAQIEDCKCAIRYLRAHASELNIDPNRIGAVGDSAGAHLAMLLGVMDPTDGLEGEGGWSDQSSKVQAVVSYFGPTNLTNSDINSMPGGGKYLNVALVRRFLESLVGGKPEEHLDLLRLASPLTYVNAGDAPMLLYQGTRDTLVPYDQAIQMIMALDGAGIQGRLEVLLQEGHGWFEDEKRVAAVTIEFLDQCFSQAREPRSKSILSGLFRAQ